MNTTPDTERGRGELPGVSRLIYNRKCRVRSALASSKCCITESTVPMAGIRFRLVALLAATMSLLIAAVGPASTVTVDEEIHIEGNHIHMTLSPDDGGTIAKFGLMNVPGNFAGENGLLQEGFGVGSFYVPNRRLNEKMEVLDAVADRPVVRYSYDCQGGNISGLRVERTMELFPDAASLRVTWRVENNGDEVQWIAPWIENDLAPGGTVDARDVLNIPTADGVIAADRTAWHPASRNWAAATDPIEKNSVYAVFDADETHSFMAVWDPDNKKCGFRAAFVPRLIEQGDVWETVYRLGAVRGLSAVHFACETLALEIDYEHPGTLNLLSAVTKQVDRLRLLPRILAANGRLWRLPEKVLEPTPDRPARCSYSWAAPADGAYDLLAKISASGDDYPLGTETGSPHGGIDSQFVVGDPEQAGMPAWTNAPHRLDRAGRELHRPMAYRGDVLMWFEPSLNKVFRNDKPVPETGTDPAIQICLAQNERESFQLVVYPPDDVDIHNIDLRIHDLVNRDVDAVIPSSDIEASNVFYYPVRVPTNFEGPTGDWPDPLPRFKPFTAPAKRSSPIWITVHADADTPPGQYVGMLEVTAPALDPVELWIKAEVYDFRLPATPALKTDFGFWRDSAVATARDVGYSGTPEQLFRLYCQNALEHRVTLRELVQLPSESADYAGALAACEPRLKALLEEGATSASVPLTLLDLPEQLHQANDFVVENNLETVAFCQIADEPLKPAWPRVLEKMQQWKDHAPDIPMMATTFGLEPFIPEALDLWNIHLPVFDTLNNKQILKRIEDGREVWWYVNHSPPRPYGNFFIDFAAVEHRILFWQAWALGVRGFHYNCINNCPPGRDPWQNQLDVTPTNGNGCLVYPSADGPVDSIRWENIRDGVEDYDYLVLLETLTDKLRKRDAHPNVVQQAVQAADLGEVVPNLVGFSRYPEPMLTKRRQIARAIVSLKKALK